MRGFKCYCRRLKPATILTGFIVALTGFPEQLLYAYSSTMMTTSSDLVTVDVSWISWVNCSFSLMQYVTFMKAVNPLAYDITWYIHRKITSNHLLQLAACSHLSCWCHFCMLRLSKNSYLDDSAHKFLMILQMNFEILDDSAHKFWRMIAQVQHSVSIWALVKTMPPIHTYIKRLAKNIS